jgi:hypothetical protein
MIAKIGYCFSVYRYGLNAFEEVCVVPALLGQCDDISNWVGSDGYQLIYNTTGHINNDHVVATSRTQEGTVLARVKLWKKSETPEYAVIIGKLTERANAIFTLLRYK